MTDFRIVGREVGHSTGCGVYLFESLLRPHFVDISIAYPECAPVVEGSKGVQYALILDLFLGKYTIAYFYCS
jgi:hypothetical protein